MLVVVEDARQQLNARSASARREARRWFMSDSRSYLHAFATICDAFDVEPVAVRAALFEGRSRMEPVARSRAGRTWG